MHPFKKMIYSSSRPMASYAHQFSATGSNLVATVCGLPSSGQTLYSPEAVLVDITGTIVAEDQHLYTDAELTTVFNGGSLFFHCYSIESSGTAIRITTGGVMIESESCSI